MLSANDCEKGLFADDDDEEPDEFFSNEKKEAEKKSAKPKTSLFDLVDDDDDEFPVKDLSTGAREQVFLGSRLGFARLALDGHPAFLILDDAFQHSDWSRREWLVQQVVTLVEAGWQVLYFTMDDHIRDLFDSTGQQLGDRYVSLALPQSTPPDGH